MVLRRPGEHAAELGVGTVGERVVEDATSDPVAGFEHDHRAAGVDDRARRREPGEPRADDDDVGGARGRVAGLGQRGDGCAGRRSADQAATRDSLGRHLASLTP